MKKKYKVTHPALGESVVAAEDKLRAVSAAAKRWGGSVDQHCPSVRI